MKIAITGATGLVGAAVREAFSMEGHQFVLLVRSPEQRGAGRALWDLEKGILESEHLERVDAVIHLAGENLAARRWTTQQKERIRESRVRGTALISESLARLCSPPQILVCASAVGFYGSRGAELLTEQSPPGTGFLAEVVQQWEAASDPAKAAGIRVVNLRFGVILSAKGGALTKMLTPFKLGLGGVIGSGEQYWSWITIDDVVSILRFVIERSDLKGPMNAVAPVPVTNREFTKTLGGALGKPTILPLPAFAARIALGEMADAALLASTRAVPTRLETAGYPFKYPNLELALRHLLRSP